ncbi:uncharacterized protein M421DRAFT_425698 [Didymella exigua CBS 183.55]|uniref:Uncharacterized protein n=1 Tax=Didymella exigua CBS 183.55 TaxID=1150837 RepID=A0A6A5R690_9PLEO|nr:uncharacterized protein M421DRAFT_425698 [Didymella exigua CBS 183.55]KAF1923635.1 hypothetical protein M421DRAFT_425698 [Didymella exigua CBS 183.55]
MSHAGSQTSLLQALCSLGSWLNRFEKEKCSPTANVHLNPDQNPLPVLSRHRSIQRVWDVLQVFVSLF